METDAEFLMLDELDEADEKLDIARLVHADRYNDFMEDE